MDSLDNLCLGCMKPKKLSGTCLNCGFNLETYEVPPHHLRPQTILNGKYLIGKELGQGGFGITYIAWDLNREIPLAIKEYFPNGLVTRNGSRTDTVSIFSGEQKQRYIQGRERFLDEARVLAKFYDTEGIVSVKEFFSENGTAYIVMEYIEGRNLGKFLKENGGKLPVDGLLEMVRPVMKALIGIHSKGLIHRDISPDNIMISEDAQVKMIDFGAAREVSNGEKSLSILLKHGYAPEEQYRTRGEQGPWTDVYALCATMYRAITGVKPSASLDRMQMDDVKTPSQLGISMDPGVEYAIMKGMAISAKDRWSNVEELYHAVYEPEKPGNPILKCKQCGETLNPGAAFCTQCGTPVLAGRNPVSTAGGNAKDGSKIGKMIVPVMAGIALILIVFVASYVVGQLRVFGNTKEATVSEVTGDREAIPSTQTASDESVEEEGDSAKKDTATLEVTQDKDTAHEEEQPTQTATEESVTQEKRLTAADIDVEESVLQIRKQYNKIVKGISLKSYDTTVLGEGATAYSENNEIKAIIVKQAYDGNAYERSYYYDGNKLFFAYYVGYDSHRLYFERDQLIRWRYCPDAEDIENAINYDLEDTSQYYRWERDVMDESDQFLAEWRKLV